MARTPSARARPPVAAGDLNLLLVHNLLRTQGCLGPALDPVFQRAGRKLTAAQFNTLLVLRDSGDEGLRMGAISARLVVTKSNVTRLVDCLESRGLVVRGGATDRRATVVHLTTAGMRVLEEMLPAYAAAAERVVDCLAPGEKETLIRLLRKLRRALRRGRG